MLRRPETSATKKVQLRQLHPLVIPVGFKPTTFRTFSRPSLSALKIKKVQPRKDAPKKVIPVGFKPTTFRTGI